MRDEGAGGVASAGYMRAGIEVRVGCRLGWGRGGEGGTERVDGGGGCKGEGESVSLTPRRNYSPAPT